MGEVGGALELHVPFWRDCSWEIEMQQSIRVIRVYWIFTGFFMGYGSKVRVQRGGGGIGLSPKEGFFIFPWNRKIACKEASHKILKSCLSFGGDLEGSQGSTIGIRHLCTYTYFYRRSHGFRHAYIDTYAYFSLCFFKVFKIFLVLFRNLLYIWPLIYLF